MEFKKKYEAMQTEIYPSASLIHRTVAAVSPKKQQRSLHIRTVALVCICFILLTSLCSLMVFAEKIPFLDHILSYLKQNKFPQSDTVTHGAVELHMEPVITTEESTNFRITETYCDGTVLVVSIVAEAEVAEEATLLSPVYNVAINNNILLDDTGNPKEFADAYTNLYRTENNLFLGSLAVDISELNLPGSFTLTLDPIQIHAVNPYLKIQPPGAQPGQYVSKTYDFENTWNPCIITVDINTDIRSEYTVEQSVEDFTLHNVITTPGFTYLEITQPTGRAAGYYYTVTDQDGNELNLMSHFAVRTDKRYYEPVPTDTRSILVNIYHWNDASEPVGVISVPVNGGYNILCQPTEFIDYQDIVYDPPLETQPSGRLPRNFFAPQENEQIISLGDTFITTADQPREPIYGRVLNSQAYAEVTFSNMQVYNSPADAGIADKDLFRTAPYDTISPQTDGHKFVTIDIHIDNFGLVGSRSEDCQREIQAYEHNDGSASSFYISKYVSAVSSLFEDGIYDPDYAYFSHHMNGPTNYDHFVMNLFDSRDFTVGFFVDNRLLESGEWYMSTTVSHNHIVVGLDTREEKGFYDMPAYPDGTN